MNDKINPRIDQHLELYLAVRQKQDYHLAYLRDHARGLSKNTLSWQDLTNPSISRLILRDAGCNFYEGAQKSVLREGILKDRRILRGVGDLIVSILYDRPRKEVQVEIPGTYDMQRDKRDAQTVSVNSLTEREAESITRKFERNVRNPLSGSSLQVRLSIAGHSLSIPISTINQIAY